ncbi:MAG TPA: pyridoxal-phosphate dependent enzyme [Puia sp.]|nr:pyridoxal-phosphate dependent enzyme [Puia sp.]
MFPGELTLIDPATVTVDPVNLPGLEKHGVMVDALRLDKIHPVVSGNKWFKLKEHLRIAALTNSRRLITFGGAWSNHIVATAFAARQAGTPVTGIIRGEQPLHLSLTLQAAASYGMHLQFISRAEYARQTKAFSGERPGKGPDDTLPLTGLADAYPGSYIIPEGGAGDAGIRGSKEILSLMDGSLYTHILCAIGTGTTWLGLAEAARSGQTIIGVPVLKGIDDFLTKARRLRVGKDESGAGPRLADHCLLACDYHFGGYARKTQELLDFMNNLYRQTGIPTDFVYTAKLFFGATDMINKGFFPSGSRLLLIHSGGLQGNSSLEPGILDF